MVMPNFFIIGAPSSGTTSLYYYLKGHPQIFLSSVKEPHFFSLAGKKYGEMKFGSYIFEEKVVDNWESYFQLFEGVSNEIAIGEASASYIYTLDSSQRIYEASPNAKIIAILRHPVDRAYSNYIRCIRNGVEPISDFEKALQEEPIRISNNWSPKWFYKSKGFYYQQLKSYFDIFKKEQIRVYLYEDLVNNSENLLREIYMFLEVDHNWMAKFNEKYNVSKIPRSRLIQKFLTEKNIIKTMLNYTLPQQLYDKVITKIKEYNLVKPELSVSIRKNLLEEYREDIIMLQSLIERDLSHWLK